MNTVLVIDDNQEFTRVLSRELRRRGHVVQSAHSGEAGLALASQIDPRLIFLDLQLPDMSGLEVLNRVKASRPDVEVVIITAHPELSSALAAIKGRVTDYLCKPFAFEELDDLLRRVFDGRSPRHRRVRAADREATAVEMIGDSPAILEVRALIRQLGRSGVRTALITGESGTGKELAARLLHAESPHRDGPFVEVNCSAVSETLFESEFFGHERGAFTGAVEGRRGLAELAHGGTLFLDEVGEIPLSCQPKLLRFLDDQSFLRVGGRKKLRVDVQIVAATNRDLRDMVAQWTFRQDLYFRLNVALITLPPLRERPDDIIPLATYWLTEANTRYAKRIAGFLPEAQAMLLGYPWPGNVRELRNLIERLVILCPDAHIPASRFPPEFVPLPTSLPPSAGTSTSLEELERDHIRKVLASVNGNKTKAAGILGISRQTLRSKLAPTA
jgi:two-component system, NtrC family, response regulator AtoC